MDASGISDGPKMMRNVDLHSTMRISNQDHIGMEMERDLTETPVGVEFGRLDRAINSLDASIMQLIHKVQSALGPEYATTNESNELAGKPEKRSIIVEEIQRQRLRVVEMSDLVETIAKRIEL